MSLASADDIELARHRSGEGPRLLFIIGSGSTVEESELLVSILSRHFDLLTYDHRGLGRSGVVTHPYDMATCAGDALVVLDAEGWEQAGVVGLSFGGMVAQELAVTHPGRVSRLALLCTSSGGPGGSSYPLHELEDLTPEERDGRRLRLMDTRFDDAWMAAHPADRRLVDLLAGRNADLDEERRVGVRRQLEARRHHDVWDRLSAIDCPTLVAAGRFDGIAPLANSEAIASRIDGAELRIYEGGHAFLAQDRDSLPEIIGFMAADDVSTDPTKENNPR